MLLQLQTYEFGVFSIFLFCKQPKCFGELHNLTYVGILGVANVCNLNGNSFMFGICQMCTFSYFLFLNLTTTKLDYLCRNWIKDQMNVYFGRGF